LDRELSSLGGVDSWGEYLACERGDGRKLYGRHVTVLLTVPRVDRHLSDQIVRLFREYFHPRCRRFRVGHSAYSGSPQIKSQLVLLF